MAQSDPDIVSARQQAQAERTASLLPSSDPTASGPQNPDAAPIPDAAEAVLDRLFVGAEIDAVWVEDGMVVRIFIPAEDIIDGRKQEPGDADQT